MEFLPFGIIIKMATYIIHETHSRNRCRAVRFNKICTVIFFTKICILECNFIQHILYWRLISGYFCKIRVTSEFCAYLDTLMDLTIPSTTNCQQTCPNPTVFNHRIQMKYQMFYLLARYPCPFKGISVAHLCIHSSKDHKPSTILQISKKIMLFFTSSSYTVFYSKC